MRLGFAGGFLGGETSNALLTLSDLAGADLWEDVLAGDLVFAETACGGGETAVTLDQFVFAHARERLEVIDVLRIVGLQTVLVLEETQEGVCRREAFLIGEDVTGQ